MKHGKQTKLLTWAEWDNKQWKKGNFTSFYDYRKSLDEYMVYFRKYKMEEETPLDNIDDAIDLQAEDDQIYDEIEERQRREYPRDK